MPPEDKSRSETDAEVTARIIGVLGFLLLLSLLWSGINQYLNYSDFLTIPEMWERFKLFLASLWPWIRLIGFAVAIAALAGINYIWRRFKKLRMEERATYNPEHKSVETVISREVKNGKWEKVIEHVNSVNASDWRLAIIEADIMLDELLRASGYDGEGVGEMLKQVEKSDMLTLDSAWAAHKVRNKIAHEGSGFLLNEREAKQAIAHYEAVFKEFAII